MMPKSCAIALKRAGGFAAASVALLTAPALAADRFVQQLTVSRGLVAVVAEGDLEARSMGSYTVRVYFDSAASPGNETTFFTAGLVRPREGVLQQATLLDVPGRRWPLLMVVMQSAGSGGYLSAEAFAVESGAVRLLAGVRDLAPTADPGSLLRRKLLRKTDTIAPP